jgi:ATP-dependent helicase Lhr and Lhr-like helicase
VTAIPESPGQRPGPSLRQYRAACQRVEGYFQQRGWRPFRFQKQVWKAYSDGAGGLLHSATGTGKTLAVWLAPVIDWLARNPDASQWNEKQPPGLKVLWITPLRALAADTEQSLRSPLEGLGLPWRLETRTGDSRASLKARQLKQLPTAMVTTPESLSILLTHERLLEQLAALECVIVDEWHELLGSKRGIQTELVLSRLRHLNPNLRTWGLSATLGNIDQACQVLMGNATRSPAEIIEGVRNKRLKMQSLIPKKIERFPWSGHIGTRMIPQVARLLAEASSALVFTNTRSQTEIWYQQLLQQRPDWAGTIALHHGSLDASVRQWVEDGLRDGKLRAVVCTSSLDLGVDFTAVDLIVQVGSPKGAARLLQRAGRSGHQPDARSHLVFVPTHALELVELAAARTSIERGVLEARQLLEKPLDVLVQHTVTIALGGGFEARGLLDEVRSTYAFRELTDEEWSWILDFVVRGGSSLTAYPDFQRVDFDGQRYRVVNSRIARMHRMNIGTIASDLAMQVRYMSGKPLGTVEESYLSKIKPGERFVFAGRVLEMVRIREGAAYVRRTTEKAESVPRWMGGRMPLSSELSAALRTKLSQAGEGHLVDPR